MIARYNDLIGANEWGLVNKLSACKYMQQKEKRGGISILNARYSGDGLYFTIVLQVVFKMAVWCFMSDYLFIANADAANRNALSSPVWALISTSNAVYNIHSH